MPSWGIPIIIVIILMIILSGFFSGTETVFASVNKIKLEKKAKAGGKKEKLAFELSNNYASLISTILIGNNLVNNIASSLGALLMTTIWPEHGETIAMVVITLSILIFGEIIPKTIFNKFSLSLSIVLAIPIKIVEKMFKPLVFIITKGIAKISPIWTPREDPEEEDTTDDELINMVEEIQEEGFIDDDTSELIQSAIEFKDTTAHEIMTPRVDIIAYNIEDDLKEFLDNEESFTYSRIIIYEETIDNIIGFVSTRKLYSQVLLTNEEVDIKEIMTPPLYVHKTKSISSLLKKFKETKTHIAVVVDEFGGTLGIVTLEDVLEEIVGEIWDETDEIEEDFIEKSDNEFIIDGDMNIYDMFEEVGLDEEELETDYETVGGWCTEVLDDFPKKDDTFTFKNLKVTVLAVDGVRVENVRVEKIEEENKEE